MEQGHKNEEKEQNRAYLMTPRNMIKYIASRQSVYIDHLTSNHKYQDLSLRQNNEEKERERETFHSNFSADFVGIFSYCRTYILFLHLYRLVQQRLQRQIQTIHWKENILISTRSSLDLFFKSLKSFFFRLFIFLFLDK